MLKHEYVHTARVDTELLHLKNQSEAPQPLVPVICTRTSYNLLTVTLDLDLEAVLEALIDVRGRFLAFVGHYEIGGLHRRYLIECVLCHVMQAELLDEERLR